MMRCLPIVLCCLLAQTTMAKGGNASQLCADRRQQQGTGAKTTVATPEENDYDIKHVKFDIALTNTSTDVSGNVTTTAKVVVPAMGIYAFELNDLLTVDSVKVDGQVLPVVSTGSVHRVSLVAPLVNGTGFTAQVFYHGQANAGNGQFFTGGLHPVTTVDGFKLMYSISDDLFADDWWPCKQSLTDKIDSVDMWVTVADTLKVGSNGLLMQTTTMPGNKLRYEWKTAYPIDYYLVSVAVAPYNEYSYYMHFTDGSNDSMLVQNYVYNTPGHFTPQAKAALDSTGLIIDHFSTLFGRYPFDKEKYGHCMSPLMGGMEHQTMTTLGTGGYSDVTLIAHELGHQWWGNNVTYASWRDIWMSEGFASYCEQLFVEQFRGAAATTAYRTGVFGSAMVGAGSVYVDDTTSVSRIFDGALTYKKGASVTHMLRYLAPQDSLFFRVLKTCQQQYARGLAVTADLQTIAEQVYGTDLDTFFNQWVYGEGYPTYGGKWYQDGNKVYLQITQTTSKPASVACFHMPLEVKLKSAAGDKIIKLYNNANSQTYTLEWDNAMTGFEIDPNNHVLNRSVFITKDATIVGIEDVVQSNISVSPNPAIDAWYIRHMPLNSYCRLTDMTGKVLWQGVGADSLAIPAADLPKGVYVLSVSINGSAVEYVKLLK